MGLKCLIDVSSLRIDRSEKKGTQLHGIFVQMDNGSGGSVAATANHGKFLSTDDPNVIRYNLDWSFRTFLLSLAMLGMGGVFLGFAWLFEKAGFASEP